MSRPLRIVYPGAWYHVMNRGRRRERIFSEEEDFRAFINLLRESIDAWGIRVGAYCLMSNHYHLLMQTPLGNLPRAMRHIDGVYTQRYNRRYGHDGQLFRGRYKAVLVQAEGYLVEVVRYIHQNPKRAGVETEFGAYPWTSHQGYLSSARRWEWLAKEPVMSLIAGVAADRRRAYIEFIRRNISEEVRRFYSLVNLKSVLGTSNFIQWVKDSFSDAMSSPEILCADLSKTTFEKVLLAVSDCYGIKLSDLRIPRRGISNEARKAAVFLARKRTGESLASIARRLGLKRHSSVVSVLRRLGEELRLDKSLKGRLDRIEKSLMSQEST